MWIMNNWKWIHYNTIETYKKRLLSMVCVKEEREEKEFFYFDFI